jgi:hypothetical protein
LPAAVTAALPIDLLPAGDSGRGAVWAYTTTDPGPRWKEPDFDDKDWPRGQMGFGTGETAVVVHTSLKTESIWLRARVFVPALAPDDILSLHQGSHEEATVFVNGRLLYPFQIRYQPQDRSRYHDYQLGPSQKARFQAGENVIAVSAKGAVDVGLRLSKGDKDAESGDGRFLPLFLGNDLAGWKGLQGYWRFDGRALAGSSPAKDRKPTTFLVSERTYRDFELRFQARLKEGVGNSGVQFRSKLADEKLLRVRGLQCEIAGLRPGSPAAGSVVTERGEVQRIAPEELLSEVYKKDDFNEFSIKCVGKHVRIMVNGFTMVDGDCPSIPDEGVIAWEFHGNLPPKEVVFNDVSIRELGARR